MNTSFAKAEYVFPSGHAERSVSIHMNCEEYKKYYAEYTNYPIPKEVWETDHYESWQDHIHSCAKCADWSLEQQVLRRGGNVEDWPCVHMAYHATFRCEKHTELSECSKAIILYNEKFDTKNLMNIVLGLVVEQEIFIK